MSAKPVVIFGVGDFARVASVYLEQDSPHPVAAFTVHEAYIQEPALLGKPVVPFERLREEYPPGECSMLVAIGFRRVNQLRAEIYGQCKDLGYELIRYVNSKAARWGEIPMGDNCFIFENNVLQPFVTIGSNVVLWSGNHIGHDSSIGDHCFVTSHCVVSGNVTVGPYCFLGVNATIRDGIQIAPRCVIGAGALVLKDTAEGGVYAGRSTEALPMKSWDLRSFQ